LADLRDGYPMHGGAKLAISAAREANSARRRSRPQRHRRYSNEASERGFIAETGHVGRFSEELGRDQLRTAWYLHKAGVDIFDAANDALGHQ
jgi:hypothetical protein